MNALTRTALVLLLLPAMAWGNEEFSMEIMDVFAITDRGTIVRGRIDSGNIQTGDKVCVPMLDADSRLMDVIGIMTTKEELDQAGTGQLVGILVSDMDPDTVAKGEVLQADC